MKKYYIKLTQENGDFILLDEFQTEETARYMLVWYEHHKDFFVGSFSITYED